MTPFVDASWIGVRDDFSEADTCSCLQGISFSDIMCVTKRNMENAVANLTKHLDTVSEAISVGASLINCYTTCIMPWI